MTYATPKVNIPALEAGDMISCKIVALIYPNGLWCARQGAADQTDEQVAIAGDVLPESVAKQLFTGPVKQGLRYRG